MFNSDIFLPIIIISGIAYSILAKKLTVLAAFTGGILACIIFIAAGYTGVAMMSTFFILASASTSWQRRKKQDFAGKEETQKGRNALQVLANAGVPAIAGIIMVCYPQLAHLMLTAMAAAFASATADTLSSELGMVYGRRFVNMITFKPDRCGMDGVISLEGTLIGIAGSCLIAIVYALGFGWNINFFFIVFAGTLGNLADSVLGALFERKGMIGNNMVNFLNTLTAVLVILLLDALF
ncbi:uncharacterized protein (TIGR00297 family) [Pedobacter sp. W3I1]|uniref:DUF92 domain-containing protein n=1 Tax=Pedobacter sp. W3I1 TaxID=3042291 RepID=UPI0027886327|nr:DUF92 domain-containing protein [Pedobacter sp. W3I1]MDQ0639583.1 uncharacterized protein (TIGR00297 family) [Pedobacter sp. W3I1]